MTGPDTTPDIDSHTEHDLASPDWAIRSAAVERLATATHSAAVRSRLAAMLDDDDLAVGKTAARVLVRHGGTAGLEAVARTFPALDDQVGTHVALAVSDALGDALPTRLDALRRSADAEVRRGADELGDVLIARPRR